MKEPSQILVVDDAADLRQLERMLLEDAGYSVDEAQGGAEAIRYLEERRPDLVLLDISMPGVDGWGVLAFVAKMPVPPKVLIVTGNGEVVPPGEVRSFVAGCIFKPFDIDQFLTACERMLGLPAPPPTTAENRKDARRAFTTEATLLSPAGAALAIGQLLDVSSGGFRVELGVPVRPGDAVRVAVALPWRRTALELRGQVRWRKGRAFGVEGAAIADSDLALLRKLLGGR